MSTRCSLRVVCAAVVLAVSSPWAPLASAQKSPTAPAQPTPAAAAPAQSAPAAVPAPRAAPVAAPTREPTEDERTRARDSYAEGQALFAEGRYEDALTAFTRAHANVPNPIVRLPIAESLRRLGRYEDAHAAYVLYLKESPEAADRAAIEQKIAELEAMAATLAVTTTPAGARVLIDGQDSGQVTPAEIALARGEHALTIELEGYTPASESLTARIGARHELAVTLEPIPPPPPTPAPDLLAVEASEPPTAALWATSIVGAAGLVGGTVLGFMALAERSDFDANPTKASADRGERLALFADVSFGIGAMAIITGAVLYLTVDETPEADPDEGHDPGDTADARTPAHRRQVAQLPPTNVRVVPVVSQDVAGVITRVEF